VAVLQLNCWAWGEQPLALKLSLLRKFLRSLGLGTDSFHRRAKQLNADLRVGAWQMQRAVSLLTLSRELSKRKLHLVGVQEVRWEGSGTVPAGEHTFCMGRGMRTMNCLQSFVRKTIISAVTPVPILSDSMSRDVF
jgi:hypothetical protein